MNEIPEIETSEPEKKPPFQFGLKHLLAAPLAVALFFAAVAVVGIFPTIVVLLSVIAAVGIRYIWAECSWGQLLAVMGIMVLLGLITVLSKIGEGVASRQNICLNNMKQIAMALLSYEAHHGAFPPAYIADENGRPMHSWRVLILPYLERKDLYDVYRFDEPWDGPNNRKLAGVDLGFLTCPADEQVRPTMTSYVAVVGPNTIWPGTGQTGLDDISDGSTQTILFVEVANSGIHWMEPRDLHVAQMAPTLNPSAGQGISSFHTGCVVVSFADGHQQALTDSISQEELRAMLTISAGD